MNKTFQRALFDMSDSLKGSPQEQQRILASVERRLDRINDPIMVDILKRAWSEAITENDFSYAQMLCNIQKIPPTIDEFLLSDDYLGDLLQFWPNLVDLAKEFRPYPLLEDTPGLIVNESGIGTGKSFIGTAIVLYDFYVMNCFHTPQRLFYGLDDTTPIYFAIQAADYSIAKEVLYMPFREAFLKMKTIGHLELNTRKQYSLECSKGTRLTPIAAHSKNLIGKAVFSAMVDEINFMDRVLQSKRSVDGGEYDQAKQLDKTLTGRRKSRFISDKNAITFGGQYYCSSVNYSDDFTAGLRESKTRARMHVQRTQWDINPRKFSGEICYFGKGSDLGRVETEKPEKGEFIEIPIEFYEQAKEDPIQFNRDYLNEASGLIRAFFNKPVIIGDAMKIDKMKIEPDMRHVIAPRCWTLPDQIDEIKNPTLWHGDLSRTSDRTGLAGATIKDLKLISLGDQWKVFPVIETVFAGTIKPSKESEIIYRDVVNVFAELKKLKVPIHTVTFDQWGAFAIQEVNRIGLDSTVMSVGTEFYEKFKELLTVQLIDLPDDPLLRKELVQLEKIRQSNKDKIDHPKNGSNDCSDAVVGATINAHYFYLNRINKYMKQIEAHYPQASLDDKVIIMKRDYLNLL